MRAHEFTDQGAAGIVLYAEDTGRYGLQQRSNRINDGGLWAAWGGGREPGETLEQCARRELAEESGYTGPIKLQRLGENSKYVTFLGTVPHEFEPRADDEWQDYCWVEAGDWPAPMHPGVAAALQNISLKENFADGKNPGSPVVDAILKVMPVAQEIWFHGSRATGKHRRNSDTDILVVVPDDFVGDQYLSVVRILQKLSSHFDNYDIQPTKAGTNIHRIAQEEGKLLWSKQGIAENFADGKVKGKSRPGRVKRSGASCKGSVSDLRARAKRYGGEKGKMYHWCANMKSGRKK